MKLYQPVKFIPKEKSLFYATAKERVEKYFADNNISRHANSTMIFKSLLLLSAYIIPYIFILLFGFPLWVNLLLWSIMGFALAGIGMSVMHDANHGAYSSNETINYLMGHSLTMLGGSVFNWKLQHNHLHHMYTNIVHVDDDITDKVMLRFSPHTTVKPVHRLQFIYVIFFYGISTLYWTLLKDFMQLARYTKHGVNKDSGSENNYTIFRLLISKAAYFFLMLLMPTLFFNIPFGELIAGFLLMHFIAGVVLTLVFQLAHTVEGTKHPLPNEKGIIENDWAVHQMETTINFAQHNKLISWYVGGLNFQVEHHLFPKICHVHYPKIAPILKQTALEFGVPYLENETFSKALKAHFDLLKRLGTMPNLDEAIAG
jgi:linoleoyl-CoA desaturase